MMVYYLKGAAAIAAAPFVNVRLKTWFIHMPGDLSSLCSGMM